MTRPRQYPVPDMVDDVARFAEKFGLTYSGKPRILTGQLGDFRCKFLQEEVNEFKEHHYKGTYELQERPSKVAECLEGMLDAALDEIYVAIGTLLMMGFTPAVIDEAWRRIQAANLAKIRATAATASERGGLYDVVKPPGWKAPDHSDLCADHAHLNAADPADAEELL